MRLHATGVVPSHRGPVPEKLDPGVEAHVQVGLLVAHQSFQRQALRKQKWRGLLGASRSLAFRLREHLGTLRRELPHCILDAGVGAQALLDSALAGCFEEAQGREEGLVESAWGTALPSRVEVVQSLLWQGREGPVTVGNQPATKRPPVGDPLLEGVGPQASAAAQDRCAVDAAPCIAHRLGKGEVVLRLEQQAEHLFAPLG